jgi:transcriptional regulator with XRE-family HTH domain
MAAFNDRLRSLREAAGMTQEGLARAAQLSVSSVAKLERGGMDPSWSTVLRLAAALGVTVQAFAEEGKTEQPPAVTERPRKGRKG